MIKKTLFTLNVNDYSKEITDLTYPLLKFYANKIGADFHVITERKFPEWPVTYEKLQIYQLGQEMKNDWNIFIDSDALIHPEALDWTSFMKKDTIAHNGNDFANVRWRYDKYFLRDGRNFGSCNWYTIGSDWCIDLWHPLEISKDEAVSNIFPTVHEHNTVITPEHLIDDYALSRNIARYGLKTTTLTQLQNSIGQQESNFHWHLYTITTDQKVNGWDEKVWNAEKQVMEVVHHHGIKDMLRLWNLPKHILEYGTRIY